MGKGSDFESKANCAVKLDPILWDETHSRGTTYPHHIHFDWFKQGIILYNALKIDFFTIFSELLIVIGR